MATRTGIENRYGSRFAKIGGATATTIKAQDAAGQTVEQLKIARGVIEGQEKSVSQLFTTAEEMVRGIDTFQQMAGINLIKNLPPPSQEIRSSNGKRLGYVQLTMRFLQAGFLHFIEETLNAKSSLEEKNSFIAQVAQYNEDVTLLGELHHLDIEDLENSTEVTSAGRTVLVSSETGKISEANNPPTPPVSPPPNEVKKEKPTVKSPPQVKSGPKPVVPQKK